MLQNLIKKVTLLFITGSLLCSVVGQVNCREGKWCKYEIP